MSLRLKIAFGVNFCIALVGFLIGSTYLVKTEITSYHKEVIGVDWSTLAPGVQKLLIVLMKGTGDAALVGAMSIAFLLLIPFRKKENWSRWAILIIGLALLIPMLIGAIYLASTTGASSPWWMNLILMLLLILGFFLSGELKKVR